MNPFMLVKGEWRHSLRGVLAVALVLGLALSLGVGVGMTERAVRQGAARAGDAFDLLVGAQGSGVELMLGAVYLRPQPLALVPGSLVSDILKQKGVAWAAPLAFGDRWENAPLVGTTESMVTLGGTRELAEGVPFAAQDEAVVGAGVPLRLGENLTPLHGQAGSRRHEHIRYRVVGRLPYTGTPWDKAVLVPIESLWAIHGAFPGGTAEPGKDGHAPDGGPAQRPEGAEHGEDGHAPAAARPLGDVFRDAAPGSLPGVSAVVVKPDSVAAAYRLRAFWQTASVPGADGKAVNTQGVFTGEVLTGLFATLGDMRAIMSVMAYAAQAVALCAVVLVALMAVAARRPLLGTLRALGAPRLYLVCAVWSMVTLSIALGTATGLLLGSGLAQGLSLLLFRQTGVVFSVSLSLAEISFAAASLLIGSLCAVIPACMVYRKKGAGIL